MNKGKFTGYFTALLFLTATSALAATNVLIIVDGSNSMWGQIDGVAKIETAKNTLGGLVADLPENTRVGLMAYGHSAEGDCKNVEVLSAIGSNNRQVLSTQINDLQPKGKTPIAYSLSQSIEAFNGLEGQNNYVVLVSDGVESCGGDPCAAAQALSDAGINVTAHVVGFGLSDDEGSQLKCIATNTGGQYFDASDTTGFDSAIKQVAQLTQKEPEPEPVAELYFEDNFDGSDLTENWGVLNSNLDRYVIDGGDLIVIGRDAGGLANPGSANIIQLMKVMPDGDWTITVEFQPDYQTGKDLLSFGLYQDHENFIAASVMASDEFCCGKAGLALTILLKTSKLSGGEATEFEVSTSPVIDRSWISYKDYIENQNLNVKTTVQLIKEGRAYRSRLTREGLVSDDGEQIWKETGSVTSLRAPKILAINAGQASAIDGETLFNVHSIKIEKN